MQDLFMDPVEIILKKLAEVIITSINKLNEALDGKTGTRIIPIELRSFLSLKKGNKTNL